MKFFIIIACIVGASNTFFAAFVFLKDRKNFSSKIFGLFSLSFALWSFSYAVWLWQKDFDQALYWSRLLNLGATFIPIFYLHFILSVLRRKRKKLLIGGYLITIIFSFFSFSSYYVKDVQPVFFFSFWPQAGFLYTIYIFLAYVGFFGYAFYSMIKSHSENFANKERQKQIQYLFLGSLISVIGGATNFPLMYSIPLMPPYGMCLLVFHPIIFTYAIFKHHLFNMKVILAELLALVIAMIFFVQIFMAEGLNEILMRILFFVIAVFFIVLLLRSIYKEVRQRERIETLASRLSNFVSFTTHELRRPIGKFRGALSMLLDGSFGQLPPEARQWVRSSLDVAIDMGHSVETFLSLNKLEIGKLEIIKQKGDINEVVSQCLNDFLEKAKEKDLKMEFRKDASLPPVFMDRFQLSHVFNNLISNAIKYTPNGGEIELSLQADNDRKNMIFSIKDTGIGIPNDVLPNLFHQYERGAQDTKMLSEGSGIGLFLAKKIVEMHGGKIWAESEGKNMGSRFSFSIPVEADPKKAKKAKNH